jgi:flagellar hook-length control protein FliK
MLALAQMLGASAPSGGVETQIAIATTAESISDVDTDSTDDAAALALLPLPIAPQLLPIAPLPSQGAVPTNNFDPLEMLGLTARPESANARDAAILQALTERLAALPEPGESVEAPSTNPTFMPSIDTQQPVRTTSDGAITRPVHVPVGTPGWADEIGTRLTMMTEKGQHTASLRLSPEHLGPLEIRIAMRDDQASVWFGAAHADTRAAIENALPRLREMFAAQGMSLADAGVFREPPRQQMPALANNGSTGGEGATAESSSAPAQIKVGLLDAYA